MGNDVRTAHDGLDAVATAEAFRPDLVLLDLGMPKLNGYDTAQRIREHAWGREITLVAVTGLGQEEDRQKSKEAGFDQHCVKPVDANLLRGLLEEMPVRV
jgi:CheY-like chemotaxis protein